MSQLGAKKKDYLPQIVNNWNNITFIFGIQELVSSKADQHSNQVLLGVKLVFTVNVGQKPENEKP